NLIIPVVSSDTSTSTSASTTSSPTTTTSGGTKLNMFKNFFKSFVPPVRDEESETQRKAHAKRVRETRRSTQGVTLEEIKSAEQFIKKQNNNNNEMATASDSLNGVNVTIKTASPTIITRECEESPSAVERRPSWRMKIDNGTCKFKLEDATKPQEGPRTPPFIRRANASSNTVQRPSSEPIETADTTVTIQLRRPKSLEEKEQDKENDVRNAQATLATQAAIQRRRRPKRRSTGVVSFDNIDDLDKEKELIHGGDCEESIKLSHQEDRKGGKDDNILSAERAVRLSVPERDNSTSNSTPNHVVPEREIRLTMTCVSTHRTERKWDTTFYQQSAQLGRMHRTVTTVHPSLSCSCGLVRPAFQLIGQKKGETTSCKPNAQFRSIAPDGDNSAPFLVVVRRITEKTRYD
ncbi:protein phosphatase 1 regulatory subunit 12A-like, partial [Anoplophora glabripennis]|uniref:protein phosphatase 1 regulatory subunit 12A-like n=1 Tax=Anoplophora glabripennis TaxID=217634 RepID=UPI0008759DF8